MKDVKKQREEIREEISKFDFNKIRVYSDLVLIRQLDIQQVEVKSGIIIPDKTKKAQIYEYWDDHFSQGIVCKVGDTYNQEKLMLKQGDVVYLRTHGEPVIINEKGFDKDILYSIVPQGSIFLTVEDK